MRPVSWKAAGAAPFAGTRTACGTGAFAASLPRVCIAEGAIEEREQQLLCRRLLTTDATSTATESAASAMSALHTSKGGGMVRGQPGARRVQAQQYTGLRPSAPSPSVPRRLPVLPRCTQAHRSGHANDDGKQRPTRAAAARRLPRPETNARARERTTALRAGAPSRAAAGRPAAATPMREGPARTRKSVPPTHC